MNIRMEKKAVWKGFQFVFPLLELLLFFWMLGGFSLIVLVLPFEPVLLFLQPRAWMYPVLAVVLGGHGILIYLMKREERRAYNGE